MEQEYFYSITISSALGIGADITFLIIFFEFPLIRYSIGLKLIKFTVIFDTIYLSSKIFAICIQESSSLLFFLNSIVMDYFFISHFNWLFFYIIYLFQIICKKVPKESISFKRLFIYDISSYLIILFFMSILKK